MKTTLQPVPGMVFVALTSMTVAACSGLMEETDPLSASSVDAATGEVPADAALPADANPSVPDANPSAPDAEPQTPCDDLASSIPAGVHYPGGTCLGCHRPGSSAGAFTIAGTIYTNTTGSAPRSGATIHIIDANDVEYTTVSADNGNFWLTETVAYPVRAYASLCPDSPSMANTIASTGAECNNCHGTDSRIHLP